MNTVILKISGMNCVNCANTIQKELLLSSYIEEAKVNFSTSQASIIYNKKINVDSIIKDIEKLGFNASLTEKEFTKREQANLRKNKIYSIISIIATIFVHILAFSSYEYKYYMIFLVATYIQFIIGFIFIKGAIKSFKSSVWDMNVLISIGTISAYIYSTYNLFFTTTEEIYFNSTIIIIAFVILGNYIQDKSKKKAGDFIEDLKKLYPKKATILVDNEEVEIDINKINIGDILVIKQGDIIACDGVIIKGESEIDTTVITGEPFSCYVKKGQKVKSGSINLVGNIFVKTEKKFTDSTISKIVNILEKAKEKSILLNVYLDKIVFYFVPTIIIIAVLTFVIWALVIGDYKSAIIFTITVLIISCPCSLGLAIPICIVATIARSAKDRLLIKDPSVIGVINNIKYAFLDKTGTLTKGDIEIDNYEIVDKKYICLLVALEKKSSHPLAKSLVQYFKEYEDNSLEVTNFEIIVGGGINGIVDNKNVLIANERLLSKHNISFDKFQKFNDDANIKTQSTLYLCIENKVIGAFSLKDHIKEDAKNFIKLLKKLNITPIMLTGDSKIRAEYICNKIGIEKVYAEVLPEDKNNIVKKYQDTGVKILMVGDGINDSIALKHADIGIAVNKSSDISKEAGSIIVLNDSLISIIKVIKILKKSRQTITQNIFWAFFYNIVGVVIATGLVYKFIVITPTLAGIAMSLSSISVVINSLRLLIYKTN